MRIERIIIENYRCLAHADVSFNEKLNIIVGNNECGKSTLLEAAHLGLTGQINGRPLQIELHPFLFNQQCVLNYIQALSEDKTPAPPHILIELYLADCPELARFKGTNNGQKKDQPGLSVRIELNPDHADDFAQYVADPKEMRTIPIEYYWIKWRDFADNEITSPRLIPLKSSLIDASTIRNNQAASRYVVDIVRDSLTSKERVDLSLSYRLMKDKFLDQPKVKAVNDALAEKKGVISDKALSFALDTSARATWEAGVMPHLDDIPLSLAGKGEQNCVKIKLAMETSEESHIILIEEAENHLSYANLNELIGHISANAGERQIFITTHSSFVLNKLGVDSVLLFHRGDGVRLTDLDDDTTQDYFMKLPGHDTLRLILARRSILVEGPSDELIVQRAYAMKHGKMPLEDGVDVISVNSLAFKRFLEIAKLLRKEVDIVTDNDGKPERVKANYAAYDDVEFIQVQYDGDAGARSLEQQMVKKNGRPTVNTILGTAFETDDELIDYMTNRKANTALAFFETATAWLPPDYIARAVR